MSSKPRTTGTSRDVVGTKLGVSGRTAERAAKVVEVIDTLEDSGKQEQAQEIRETLNRSVTAAYKDVKPILTIETPEIKSPIKKTTFNATNDNIEWAKWSWNPVTGCEHDCPYCYARDIGMRFTGHFRPEFHEDRLSAPQHTKIPASRQHEPGIQNVFVCSMADLFGSWVPDAWIDHTLSAVRESPQWNFLFLTKHPERYLTIDFPANCWVGASADTQARADRAMAVFTSLAETGRKPAVTFLSSEPLSERITLSHDAQFGAWLDWVIVGGRSKSAKMPAAQPEWEWVEHLLVQARRAGVKLYFKPNLTVQPKEYPR